MERRRADTCIASHLQCQRAPTKEKESHGTDLTQPKQLLIFFLIFFECFCILEPGTPNVCLCQEVHLKVLRRSFLLSRCSPLACELKSCKSSSSFLRALIRSRHFQATCYAACRLAFVHRLLLRSARKAQGRAIGDLLQIFPWL